MWGILPPLVQLLLWQTRLSCGLDTLEDMEGTMLLTTSTEAALADLGFELRSDQLPVFLGDSLEDAMSTHAGLRHMRDMTRWCEGAIISRLAESSEYGDAAVDQYAGKIGVSPSTARSWKAVYERYSRMETVTRGTVLGMLEGLHYSHYRAAHRWCEDDQELAAWLKKAHDGYPPQNLPWTVAELLNALAVSRGAQGTGSTGDDDAGWQEDEDPDPPQDEDAPPPARSSGLEAYQQELQLLQTVIAGLVYAAGGELRIPRWCLEDPPDVEMDDDPENGDWIYRLAPSPEGGGQ